MNSPQATKGRVKYAHKHQDGSDVMKINPRYLTESKRRRVDEKRAHENDVNEKQKARNLSNSRVVSLL